MSDNIKTFVQCGFCEKFGQLPEEGGSVPDEWFFVVRPRTALGDERSMVLPMTGGGTQTVERIRVVDRWIFCSENCLAHIAEMEASVKAEPAGPAEGPGYL